MPFCILASQSELNQHRNYSFRLSVSVPPVKLGYGLKEREEGDIN